MTKPCDEHVHCAKCRPDVGRKCGAAIRGRTPWTKGRPRSPETKAKISAANRGRTPPNKGQRRTEAVLAEVARGLADTLRAQEPDLYTQFVQKTILGEFPCVEREVAFGRYVLDLYLPSPYHLAFEIDSDSHYRRRVRDQRRDIYLQEHFSLPVVRILHDELSRRALEMAV